MQVASFLKKKKRKEKKKKREKRYGGSRTDLSQHRADFDQNPHT